MSHCILLCFPILDLQSLHSPVEWQNRRHPSSASLVARWGWCRHGSSGWVWAAESLFPIWKRTGPNLQTCSPKEHSGLSLRVSGGRMGRILQADLRSSFCTETRLERGRQSHRDCWAGGPVPVSGRTHHCPGEEDFLDDTEVIYSVIIKTRPTIDNQLLWFSDGCLCLLVPCAKLLPSP